MDRLDWGVPLRDWKEFLDKETDIKLKKALLHPWQIESTDPPSDLSLPNTEEDAAKCQGLPASLDCDVFVTRRFELFQGARR